MDDLDRFGGQLPLVAILRGLEPEESLAIGEALLQAGFRLLDLEAATALAADSGGNRPRRVNAHFRGHRRARET